jgi:hypothetical protein
MAWEARQGLKLAMNPMEATNQEELNGLGSPSGIETVVLYSLLDKSVQAKWPGKPVRD